MIESNNEINKVKERLTQKFSPSFVRSALRERTGQESAPQTAGFPALGSARGWTSRPGRATTAGTRHPEAEDGPSGESSPPVSLSHARVHTQIHTEGGGICEG